MYDKKEVERVFEKAILDHKLKQATILRLPAVYGSGDPQRRFSSIVEAFALGHTEIPHINGACWRWTYSHVKDVAYAILLAAEAKHLKGYHIFNIGEKTTLTMHEWVEAIASEMGVDVSWKEVEKVPKDKFFLGLMNNDVVVDSSKIRNLLKYNEITTFKERISDLVKYLIT